MNAGMSPTGLPRPVPLPAPVPPQLAAPTAKRRVVAIVALSTAAAGMVVLLFGLLAESDTGRPDGTACTAKTGDAYRACLRQSEYSGLLMWAVTMGVAAAGLTMLLRTRHDPGPTDRLLRLAAALASGVLAVAGALIWARGAGGGYYDDLIGATTWSLAMLAGLFAGALLGWIVTRTRPR